jgi:hypothetical protein
MMNPQTRGRLTLLVIAAIFFIPILTAVYFYFSPDGWRPGERTERGTLINPPRMLPDTPLNDAEPAPVMREVWTLLVPAGSDCDAVCRDALVKIRQLRLWMGPKMSRVQTVILPACAGIPNADVLAEHPQLIVADPERSATIRERVGDWSNGQVFVVDPFGNLMMTYAPGTDMGDMRKDLGQLLRISTIG